MPKTRCVWGGYCWTSQRDGNGRFQPEAAINVRTGERLELAEAATLSRTDERRILVDNGRHGWVQSGDFRHRAGDPVKAAEAPDRWKG